MAARAPAEVESLSSTSDLEMKQSHNSPEYNAFTELMKPKPKPHRPPPKLPKMEYFARRDELLQYTVNPENVEAVVYYDDHFVVIRDKFPKSIVHLLIIPRDSSKNGLRGQEAFHDAQFLADMREVEKKARKIAAEELRRLVGEFSATEAPRRKAQEADEIPDEMPAGRDWESEIMTGTHATPSMNHLHVHVLSKDLRGEKMSRSNHYQSFTTDFFIQMDEYPLAATDTRRGYHWRDTDLICWRCGRNFGRQMAKLQKHLDHEFDSWKRT